LDCLALFTWKPLLAPPLNEEAFLSSEILTVSNELFFDDNSMQGIHNVFIVIPQFIITGLSSIIFAILDPDTSVLDSHGRHPAHPGAVPGVPTNSTMVESSITNGTSSLRPRVGGEVATRSADSVAVIFWLGGFSAAIACVLAVRLARQIRRARR